MTFFSLYVCLCACVFLIYHGLGSLLSYMFKVILRFINRNIWAKYKGNDLLWDHIMSHKVFLLPGMIYALPSPNIADKNCISVDSMESY